MDIEDNSFPVYIINLKEQNRRLKAVCDNLRQVGLTRFEAFEAVDGRALEPDSIAELHNPRKAVDRSGRPFTREEIGCALSHRNIYQNLIDSDDEWALVLEDDARLDPDTRPVLESAAEWLSSINPRVLLLTAMKEFLTRNALPLFGEYRMAEMLRAWSGAGYAINRSAAAALALVNTPIWLMADDWAAYSRRSCVEIKGVDPWLIYQAKIPSSLEAERDLHRKQKKRTFRYRLGKLRDNIGHKLAKWFWWKPFFGLRGH